MLLKNWKNLDYNILEKNFIKILNIFSKNEELFTFLNSLQEEETRDWINGLFENDNDQYVSIELKDIEILINAVCFVLDLKSKRKNFEIFLNQFHSLLDFNNEIYPDFLYNLVHIDCKLSEFKYYIKNQLRKKYKFSENIEKCLKGGKIKFIKTKKT